MTLNVWQEDRWPDRRDSIQALMRTFRSDLLCLQEAAAVVQQAIVEALPGHGFVRDDFAGWASESNIFWNADAFERIGHGTRDVGGHRSNRRLFWVRLRHRQASRELLASTAHFAWPGHKEEAETGLSPRVRQSQLTLDALNELAASGGSVFFTGDLNEPVHPRRILHAGGFVDCFTAMALPCAPTRPARPLDDRPDEACDWIFSRGGVRPVLAAVPHFYHRGMPPSDHWPVVAVYELE